MPLLSVVIPAYNEDETAGKIIEKINSLDLDKEIIVVDDASTDRTADTLKGLNIAGLKVIYHSTNRGKGAAFITGLSQASGDLAIIQDADLEYDPADYFKLLDVIRQNPSCLVLGVRFNKGYKGLLLHQWGNKFLTATLNFLFGSSISDYATCYKLASRQTWKALDLRASRFDIDAEIICSALKKKIKIIEAPVSYAPRSYREGKKIRCKDAFWALFYMLKFRLTP